MVEQFGYDLLRVGFLRLESGAVVELFVQELFCFAPLAVNFRTENREPLRPVPNVFQGVGFPPGARARLMVSIRPVTKRSSMRLSASLNLSLAEAWGCRLSISR